MVPQKTTRASKPPKTKSIFGFTLIELIVVITILAILGTIGFLSIGGYSSKARDSARIGDTAQISKSLDLSIITAGVYPNPDNFFSVTYSGGIVWNQGTVGSNVIQYLRGTISGGGLNKKPVDPLKNTEYTYSSLSEGRAYQLKMDYEGDLASVSFENSLLDTAFAAPGDPTIAYIRGNYGGLTAKTTTGGIVYILAVPSIITNSGTTAGGFLSASSLSGTLMFHGKSLRNASLFNPGTLIFSGAKTTTNPSGLPDTSTGVIAMMSTLKSIYGVSDIQNLQQVATLINTSTGLLSTFGTSIISTQLGGSAVSAGGGGGGEVVGDQTPPTGGNLILPATTNTTSVTLTITCPTDAAGNTPIQMYISGVGLASGGNIWETCASSKNITITTGDGSKAITIKWRDSIGNETGVMSGNVNLNMPPTFLDVGNGYWVIEFNDSVFTSGCRNDFNTTYRKDKCILKVTPSTPNLNNTPTNTIFVAPSDSIVSRINDDSITSAATYCNSLNSGKSYSNIGVWRLGNMNPEVYNLYQTGPNTIWGSKLNQTFGSLWSSTSGGGGMKMAIYNWSVGSSTNGPVSISTSLNVWCVAN